MKDSELIPVKLAVGVDTVATRITTDKPEPTSDANTQQKIAQDELKDNVTNEGAQIDSTSSIDRSTDSNSTAGQLLVEQLANDSISNEVDNSSTENFLESDTSAEIMSRIKPTLNPLFKKGMKLDSKEVLDDEETLSAEPTKSKAPDGEKSLRDNVNPIETLKSEYEKSNDSGIENTLEKLQNPENFVTPRSDTLNTPPAISGNASVDSKAAPQVVENGEIQDNSSSMTKEAEPEKKPESLEKHEAENNPENSTNTENNIPSDQNASSSTTDAVDDSVSEETATENSEEKSKEDPNALPMTSEPENVENFTSPNTEDVSLKDQAQNIPQPEATVNDKSIDRQTTSAVADLETKNDSTTPQDAPPDTEITKSESKEVIPDSSQDTVPVVAVEDQTPSGSPDPLTSFSTQPSPTATKDEKPSSSEAIPEQTENVTDSASTIEDDLTTTDDKIEQTNETIPLDSVTPKTIPLEIQPPNVLDSTTEPSLVESTENIDSSKVEFDSSVSNVTDQDVPTSPILSVAEETPFHPGPTFKLDQPSSYFPENTSDEQSSEEQQKPDPLTHLETPTPEIPPPSEPSSSSSESIDIDPKHSPSEPAEIEQQHGLNEFIHAPRKKVDENEIESFENQGEKSIYETIQDYFPDWSAFQVADILPLSSIDSVKSFFDFGFSTQKHEEEKEFCSAGT